MKWIYKRDQLLSLFLLLLFAPTHTTTTTSSNTTVTTNNAAMEAKAKCFWIYNQTNVVDLGELTRPSGLTYDKNVTDILTSTTFVFNFCDDTYLKCNNQSTTFYGVNEKLNKCVRLAGDKEQYSIFSFKAGGNSSLFVQLSDGEKCPTDLTRNYKTSIEFVCNNDIAEGKIKVNSGTSSLSNCDNTFKIETPEACVEKNYYVVWGFYMKYFIAVGIIFIVIGLYLTFFGGYFSYVVIFLIGMIVFVVFVIILIFGIFGQFTRGVTDIQMIIVLSVSAFVGLLYSIIMLKFIQIFHINLGAILGFILGQFVYNLIFSLLAPLAVLYWIIVLSFVILFAVLSLWLSKPLLIITTSLVGSYAVIRGISLMAGGFPDEGAIMDLNIRKEYEQIKVLSTWKTYIYLASFAVLCIIGIFVQYRFKKTENVEDDNTIKLNEQEQQLTPTVADVSVNMSINSTTNL